MNIGIKAYKLSIFLNRNTHTFFFERIFLFELVDIESILAHIKIPIQSTHKERTSKNITQCSGNKIINNK